uniref:Uncharacterized protein n=1 Tax=Anguilla anguilla TaxID=7936 RepID=A0A0E9UM79_ANGAN
MSLRAGLINPASSTPAIDQASRTEKTPETNLVHEDIGSFYTANKNMCS